MPTIKVPGTDDLSTTVGEIVTIEFIEDCCFCCDPTQVDMFYPQLPLGDHKKGYVWTGAARETGTIQFHHTSYGGECMARHAVPAPQNPGRVIIVGGGG